MKRKIRIISLSVAVIVVLAVGIVAWMNVANIRVAFMLKGNKYYELNQYLSQVSGNVNPMLHLMGEAVTGSNFNRREKANHAIDKLLEEYAAQLDSSTMGSLAGLKLANLFIGSEYEAFNETMRGYAQVYPLDASFQTISEICGILADVARLNVTRPREDVEIPISYRRTGRGETLCLDAMVKGKRQPYVFDTGAMKWNMTTEELAVEQGIHIICDSLHVSGVTGGGTCKVGVLDSMELGTIIIRHPVFVVIPDSMSTYKLADGSIVKLGNVLGTDVMNRLGEIRIDNTHGRMTIPHKQTEAPGGIQNLMCQTGNYMLYAAVNGEVLKMNFDTGNVKTTLSGNYFHKHKSHIEKSIPLTKGEQGGFGGVHVVNQYILPTIPVKLNGRECTLDNVAVIMDDHSLQEDEYGSLGVDFIRSYKTVVINFEKMFVEVY